MPTYNYQYQLMQTSMARRCCHCNPCRTSSSLYSLILLLSCLQFLSWLYCTTIVTALNPIEIRGYKFFDSVTGEEFRFRGIDYYPRPNTGDLNHNSLDYFTEDHRHIWERDVPYLQTLGVNAIRIYAIDATQNHDAFFCALDHAGIYVIVELARDCPNCAITRDAAPHCYPPLLKFQGQDIIRRLSRYSNVLAFSAGNEVNHYAPPGTPQINAPCQKKFLRDMRYYAHSCSKRTTTITNDPNPITPTPPPTTTMRLIPIGLVAADTDRTANALYYNCQDDTNNNDPFQRAEWFGLNSYVNCDGKVHTYRDALGFNTLQQSFASYNYSIPVILTEFGCVSNSFPTIHGYQGQRNFLQFVWLHSIPQVRDQFVGGFAFEYSMEMENAKSESPWPFTTFGHANYGVGYFQPKECDDIDIPCDYVPLPSYDSLRHAYEQVANMTFLSWQEFVIPPSRQGPSVCPDNFPALQDFDWSAVDRIEDLPCPPHQRLPTSFVCPADLNELRPKPKLFHWSNLFISNRTFLQGVVGSVVIVIAACIFFVLLRRRGRRLSDKEKREQQEQESNQVDDVDGNNVVVVSIPKYRRDDIGTSSNESMGLLSVTDTITTSPKSDYYQAIDESSENSLSGENT